MFTGIIENTGIVTTAEKEGSNMVFWINSSLAKDLKVDQSLSHNGACLTVEDIKDESYKVTAIEETILKTNLGTWKAGTRVNLERCLLMNGRVDGHIVQGHVDTTGLCLDVKDKSGSFEFTFEIGRQFSSLIIEKGSVAVNGISLTIFNVTDNTFKVGIIPYTFNNTNISQVSPGDQVNIEFDMIGKYVTRLASLHKSGE